MTHSTHGDRMARLRQAGSGHRRRRLARPVSEELSDQVSHRPFRSTLVSVASGLAAAIAISWVCGPAPARAAAGYSAAGRGVQAQEWWLGGLHVRQTWPSTQGTGITVAVLGTGVNPGFAMDALPIALTAVCERVERVTVHRVQDARMRRLPFQQKIGAGLTTERIVGAARLPAKPGRNDPCPCGSGKKFKKCCGP